MLTLYGSACLIGDAAASLPVLIILLVIFLSLKSLGKGWVPSLFLCSDDLENHTSALLPGGQPWIYCVWIAWRFAI